MGPSPLQSFPTSRFRRSFTSLNRNRVKTKPLINSYKFKGSVIFDLSKVVSMARSSNI